MQKLLSLLDANSKDVDQGIKKIIPSAVISTDKIEINLSKEMKALNTEEINRMERPLMLGDQQN